MWQYVLLLPGGLRGGVQRDIGGRLGQLQRGHLDVLRGRRSCFKAAEPGQNRAKPNAHLARPSLLGADGHPGRTSKKMADWKG